MRRVRVGGWSAYRRGGGWMLKTSNDVASVMLCLNLMPRTGTPEYARWRTEAHIHAYRLYVGSTD